MIKFYELNKKHGIECVDRMCDIASKYLAIIKGPNDFQRMLDDITNTCKSIWVRSNGNYGMLFPEEKIIKAFPYLVGGKITNNPQKATHRHYLDDEGKVRVTEYIIPGSPSEFIFYFYNSNNIEYFWYYVSRQLIERVGEIFYSPSNIIYFRVGDIIGEKIFVREESIMDEKDEKVSITARDSMHDQKASTQTLPRSEAHPEKKGGRKVGDTAKDFEEVVYNKIKQAIEGWNESDIYAISFFVENNESNCFEDYCNLSTFYISYNTESNCDGAGRYDEERWNYAFWLQNEVTIVDTENEDGMMDLLLAWYKKQNVQNIGEEEGEIYDRFFRYIGKGPNGHYELLMLAANTAKRIQEEGLLKSKFGKNIPIIVHGLEYAWYDIEATKIANPQGQAKDFLKATKNW